MRILAVIGLVAALPAAAQERVPDLTLGAEVYAEACQSCHGPAARGDGPMAGALAIPVPDLTGLSSRNGGRFPWLTIVHMVDGRSGLRGHGGPMPVFGALMKGDSVAVDAPDGSPLIVSKRVLAVVDWLESIQE